MRFQLFLLTRLHTVRSGNIHQGLQSPGSSFINLMLHHLWESELSIKRRKLGLNVRVAKYQKEALRMHLTSIDSSLLRQIHLIWREFLEDREEHEEEEVANAGPSENVSQPRKEKRKNT